MYQFWGKTRTDSTYHLLIYHLLDTANVALYWMEKSSTIKAKLASYTYVKQQSDLFHFVAFLCGMHDIGKLSHRFQNKSKETCTLLQAPIKDIPTERFDHGGYGAYFLQDALLNNLDHFPIRSIEKKQRKALEMALVASASHHGCWLKPNSDTFTFRKENEDQTLQSYRIQMVKALWELFPFNMELIQIQPPRQFAIFLAGLVSVSDWIASNDNFFPYQSNKMNLAEYMVKSAKHARLALNKTGLVYSNPFDKTKSANFLFPLGLRPIQKMMESLKGKSGLVLIEAPTGEGKTEAALIYLVDAIKRGEAQGAFFGLPTKATSNAIYDRMLSFLTENSTDQTILELTHSSSWIHQSYLDTYETLETPYDELDFQKDQVASVVSKDWFHSGKRSLLAQFGVGTVDQMMKAVLSTRHFFVRIFALSSHVVIFDEIHAYDSYMDYILTMLFRWLGANRIPTVLLSASLPASKKRMFLEAYSNKSLAFQKDSYPLITFVNNQELMELDNIPVSIKREVTLTYLYVDNIDRILETLHPLFLDQGCACIIVNTVNRCQEVFNYVQHKIPADVELYCFHSQFTYGDRARIERDLQYKFGKSGERPKRAILVATQVVEQSLDVDFDVMISELAPIDLLIQRMGRLHRHTDRVRPSAFPKPALTLIVGHNPPGCHIYPNILALRTLQVLEQKHNIQTPTEIRPLIESVYTEPVELPAQAFHLTLQDVNLEFSEDQVEEWNQDEYKTRKHMESQAKKVIIPTPWEDKPIYPDTFEDEEADQKYIRALTRLGEETISVLILYLEKNSVKNLLNQEIFLHTEGKIQKNPGISKVEYLSYIFKGLLNLLQQKLGDSEDDRVIPLERDITKILLSERRFTHAKVFVYKNKEAIPYSSMAGYLKQGGN